MPSYNNAATLCNVIERTRALGLPIIVVNDGSTDSTADLLKMIVDAHSPELFRVVAHSNNRGKAAALQTGFSAAIEGGYTHAITIDTDGQLDPEDIPELIERAKLDSDALIVGARNDRAADYPKASRIGRRISNFAIRLECGAKAHDSQCGLRVYPLKTIDSLNVRAGRFGYEAEVITRFVWAGGRVENASVRCRYFAGEQRISHYKQWPDTFLGVVLHVRLLLRALWPAPHRQLLESNRTLQTRDGFWQKIGRWINPCILWRQLRGDGAGRLNIAAGFSIGVFIANLPLYGLQTLLSLYVSRRWHLHAIPIVAGSNLSIPPIAPFLILAAIYIGHMILFGAPPSLAELEVSPFGLLRAGAGILSAWIVGGILLGMALAVIAFGIVYSALGPFSPKDVESKVRRELINLRNDD